MNSFLCVGGPHAGQKYDTGGRDHFTVPERINTTPLSPGAADEKTIVKTITYRQEIFHTATGSIMFWVPEGQTWFETMTLLLEGYELTIAATKEVARQKVIIFGYEQDRIQSITAKDMGQPG